MPFHFADGFTDASEAFVHGAMCCLPGPNLGDIDRFDFPVAEELSGLFNADALHAVLAAAVEHPEWAAAWHAALTENCSGDCGQLAEELLAAAPISFRESER